MTPYFMYILSNGKISVKGKESRDNVYIVLLKQILIYMPVLENIIRMGALTLVESTHIL